MTNASIKIARILTAALLPILAGASALAEHPPIALLDRNGQNVLESGLPISTMRTCGDCHDTQYIASHNNHVAIDSREGSVPHGAALDSPQIADAELNCFLCHVSRPDNKARREELEQDRSPWANTATLAATNLVRRTQAVWAYDRAAFLPDGRLEASKLGLQTSKSENCGLCHGLVDRGEQPLRFDRTLQNWSTATRGAVFSPGRLCESALNLQHKENLSRTWDVHAERLLQCTSCHYSSNNPAFYEPDAGARPRHLAFDPRRLTAAEYLKRPNHDFAGVHVSPGSAAGHPGVAMRQCADCHRAAETHAWLPYREAHFAKISCEACHISQVYGPAVRQVDWTLLTPTGEPQIQWRGIEGDPINPTAEVEGFHPVLLAEQMSDGQSRLVPNNLVTMSYWLEGGKQPRRVGLEVLKAAMIENGHYHPDIARIIGDGPTPLDSPAKVEAVRNRLQTIGVAEPRIAAEVQPYRIHHGVAAAKWAIRDCETCHTEASRLGERFMLASYLPGGIAPQSIGSNTANFSGVLQTSSDGKLVFEPRTQNAGIYVLGHNGWPWVDFLGGLLLVTVALGVAVHSGLRIGFARKRSRTKNAVRPQKAASPS